MWSAILKWSLAQNDGTKSTSDAKPMSEEDRKWLEEVMNSMVVDEVARMKLIVEVLKIPEDPATLEKMYDSHELQGILLKKDPQEMENQEEKTSSSSTQTKDQVLNLVLTKKKEMLEELDTLVDRIDMAKDLNKIGGFIYIIKTLGSKYPSLQWRAAQVFATVVQNNPYCQEVAHKLNATDAIIRLFYQFLSTNNPSNDEIKVVFKALTASSCFIRSYEPALRQFVKGGVKGVIKTLISEKASLRTKKKVLFLLCYLVEQEEITKATRGIICLDAIPAIIKQMFNTKSDVVGRENSIRIMILMCKNGGVDEIRKEKFIIIPQVKSRQDEIQALVNQDDIEMCEDEANLLHEFLDILENFVYVPPVSSVSNTTNTNTNTKTNVTTIPPMIEYDQTLD